jgi:MFS family permease
MHGRVAENVAWPVSLLALLATVISLLFRWRGSGGLERQQVKWLAYTGVSIDVALLSGIASGYVSGEYSYPTVLILSVAIAGLTIGVPMAIAMAMLRHHLYDIDVVINRTLVYSVLTAMLAVVYFGGVTAMQAIFRTLTGQEQQPQLAVVVSTLAIAALFTPYVVASSPLSIDASTVRSTMRPRCWRPFLLR